MLKPHVVGLFVKELRGSSYGETTDFLFLRYGRFGELLNCKYCLSGYLGLAFFTLFNFIPETAAGFVAAFFSMPLFVELITVRKAVTSTATTKPKSDKADSAADAEKPTPSNRSHWKLNLTPELREKLDKVREDPKSHKKFLIDNQDILALISSDKPQCDFSGCQELVDAYHEEIKDMLAENQRDPMGCPECMRGTVINKYVFKLMDARAEAQIDEKISEG